MDISKVTPYQDVNIVLCSMAQGIERILGNDLRGLYLCGSLSYGDFNPQSSDIDLVAILNRPASANELEPIRELHSIEAQKYPKWAKRLECSYTPIEMLSNILPPREPRPYYGEGVLYPAALYGNEWIINLYLQYNHGITLLGPEFTTLVAPIDILEVQKASIRDLFKEWQPKLADPGWLDNSHYQSYLVLNLCRILYTVMNRSTGSKKVSAAWAKDQYPEWSTLVQAAEDWHYGTEMTLRAEALAFLKFVIKQIGETALFDQI
jgi:predicted nucleotidyltransferase